MVNIGPNVFQLWPNLGQFRPDLCNIKLASGSNLGQTVQKSGKFGKARADRLGACEPHFSGTWAAS